MLRLRRLIIAPGIGIEIAIVRHKATTVQIGDRRFPQKETARSERHYGGMSGIDRLEPTTLKLIAQSPLMTYLNLPLLHLVPL